jgi:hypothetical protein
MNRYSAAIISAVAPFSLEGCGADTKGDVQSGGVTPKPSDQGMHRHEDFDPFYGAWQCADPLAGKSKLQRLVFVRKDYSNAICDPKEGNAKGKPQRKCPTIWSWNTKGETTETKGYIYKYFSDTQMKHRQKNAKVATGLVTMYFPDSEVEDAVNGENYEYIISVTDAGDTLRVKSVWGKNVEKLSTTCYKVKKCDDVNHRIPHPPTPWNPKDLFFGNKSFCTSMTKKFAGYRPSDSEYACRWKTRPHTAGGILSPQLCADASEGDEDDKAGHRMRELFETQPIVV